MVKLNYILFLLAFLHSSLFAQNTPWDIIYCLNGGENKSAGITSLPIPNPPDKPGWKLIFRDEFDDATLNASKWNRSSPGDDKDSCMRSFSVNPANIFMEDGAAGILNTIDEYKPGCPYSFGEIKTMSVRDTAFGSYYFYAPGYLETRVKLFSKAGQGAACWLWGIGTRENPGTPGPWTEIDVFEIDGVNANMFNGTYHWTYDDVHISQNHKVYLTESAQPYDLSANWTTFGLEWDSAVIRWFVNNMLVKELDLTRIPPFCLEAEGYTRPDVPFCVRFNSGNNTVGNQSSVANPADFPQAMLVDYVRVYKKDGYKAAPVVIRDGLPQVCASASLPMDSGKFIHAPYYPDVQYLWTSSAFDLLDKPSPLPQPPGRKEIRIRQGIQAGNSYPISLETRFPGDDTEFDTVFIYVAPGPPEVPSGDFFAQQIDSLCRFAVSTVVASEIATGEYSFDNGLTWLPGTIHQEGVESYCSTRSFKPEQNTSFGFRTKNICGYSPVRFASLTMPAPPTGCTWPTSIDESFSADPAKAARFSFFPNPVLNSLTIRMNPLYPEINNGLILNIFDIYGRMVHTEYLDPANAIAHLGNLQKGMYCLQLCDGHSPPFRSAFLKY